MMRRPFAPALKASAINLLLSAVLIALSLGALIFWFFPYPFIAVDDITTAIVMVIGINLCLGPLLTLLLYKPGKKGLLLDLCTVAILQLAALTYGLSAIYDSRPAYLVFYGDSFYLADHKQIDQSTLQDETLQVGPWDRPRLVASVLPGNHQERMLVALESMASGTPLTTDARYFHSPRDVEKAQWLLLALNPQSFSNIPDRFRDNPRYALFHVVSAKTGLIAIFDTDELAIVDTFLGQKR